MFALQFVLQHVVQQIHITQQIKESGVLSAKCRYIIRHCLNFVRRISLLGAATL